MTMKTRLATRVKHIFKSVAPRKTVPCYLVNYDGGPSSVAALREACEMARPGTRVVAVFLDVVPYTQEIEPTAPGHEMLAQAVLAAALVNARVYGMEIETLAVPCRVQGPAFVAFAMERASQAPFADVTLFIGVDESASEPQLSPFADYVISFAPCKVVLVGRETFEYRKMME
jgi:hypothetical protein